MNEDDWAVVLEELLSRQNGLDCLWRERCLDNISVVSVPVSFSSTVQPGKTFFSHSQKMMGPSGPFKKYSSLL